MRVWLLKIGEPLPIDPGTPRLIRTGILAQALAAAGHEVTWWTSTFSHISKKQRYSADTEVYVSSHLRIRLIRSPGYRRNISLARLVDHALLARSFMAAVESEPRPDLIVCSLPTLDFASAATTFAKKNAIPVVLDILDMWPDALLDVMPKGGRWLGRVALAYYYHLAAKSCSQADAILGPTPGFVEWGIRKSGREARKVDKDFPFGYTESTPPADQIETASRYWDDLGILSPAREFTICFFGSIGHQFEFETVIQAARTLSDDASPVKFVLCGTGDNFEAVKALASGLNNVTFPGWIGFPEIWTLMRRSSVGLAPYKVVDNFTNNLPNKPIEYFSAGLPVVSSLPNGTLYDLLRGTDSGLTYESCNPNSLVDVLRQLRDDSAMRKRKAMNAARIFREKFVAETTFQAMVDHLKEVVTTYHRLKPQDGA